MNIQERRRCISLVSWQILSFLQEQLARLLFQRCVAISEVATSIIKSNGSMSVIILTFPDLFFLVSSVPSPANSSSPNAVRAPVL